MSYQYALASIDAFAAPGDVHARIASNSNRVVIEVGAHVSVSVDPVTARRLAGELQTAATASHNALYEALRATPSTAEDSAAAAAEEGARDA